MGKFILDDFSRDPVTGELKNGPLKKVSRGAWLGHGLCLTPFEARTALDFTGPPGAATGIYYSLVFQLGKWEYFVKKANEWIEVSPVHAQYYQLTQKQKEDLEGRIKSGLASAATATADYELLLHDERKYKEMLHYMGYQSKGNEIYFPEDDNSKGPKEREKLVKHREGRIDNHSLKAMFIDQIDFHTGEGISMRSIVSRWPTMISDFMRMDDGDLDPNKVMKKLDISRAEAVVLVTKNKLFIEWKNIFLPEVKNRYKRIMELVRSRELSVREYKEWLKPYIAKHKLIQEGLATEGGRESALTSFVTPVGHAVSMSEIELWVWKDFISPEIHKVPGEYFAANKALPIYDDWTRRNIIFHKDWGLNQKYPWITEKWVKDKLNEFTKSMNPPWFNEKKEYYSFFVIKFNRTNLRTATGEELEDGVFDVNLVFMSQNVLFAKLLDLKAKMEEFNKYVDSLLGLARPFPPGDAPLEPKESAIKPVKDFFDAFSIPLQFVKGGPYERDFEDRITKYMLRPVAGDRYVPIVNFIKQKMGYGGGGGGG